MKTKRRPDVPCPSPTCKEPLIIRKGFFRRACDSKVVARFFCKSCGTHFSSQTGKDTYRHKKVREIPLLLRFLTSGSSQRKAARNLKLTRKTVARKVTLLAARAKNALDKFREELPPQPLLQFDEMESFEHTKCKPISIPLVVTEERFILGAGVARMPAKGLLTKVALKKYGTRADERRETSLGVLAPLRGNLMPAGIVLTDKNPHYPKILRDAFEDFIHKTTRGGRGCTVGYGEVKKKGFDIMFALNHTAAMLRDILATLKRRTWTTAKCPRKLLELVYIAAWSHNLSLLKRQEERLALSNQKPVSVTD